MNVPFSEKKICGPQQVEVLLEASSYASPIRQNEPPCTIAIVLLSSALPPLLRQGSTPKENPFQGKTRHVYIYISIPIYIYMHIPNHIYIYIYSPFTYFPKKYVVYRAPGHQGVVILCSFPLEASAAWKNHQNGSRVSVFFRVPVLARLFKRNTRETTILGGPP